MIPCSMSLFTTATQVPWIIFCMRLRFQDMFLQYSNSVQKADVFHFLDCCTENSWLLYQRPEREAFRLLHYAQLENHIRNLYEDHQTIKVLSERKKEDLPKKFHKKMLPEQHENIRLRCKLPACFTCSIQLCCNKDRNCFIPH